MPSERMEDSRPWEDPSRTHARNALKLLMNLHEDFGSPNAPAGFKPFGKWAKKTEEAQ